MTALLGTIISQLETPSEENTLNRWLEYRIADIHVAMPGEVIQYHAADNTVDVQPLISRSVDLPDGSLRVEVPPALLNVPVCFQRGGGCAVTFELAPHDTVLLVFCERALDGWWGAVGGELTVSNVTRKHDWSDAIAIPGLQNRSGAPNPDPLKMLVGAVDGSATLKLDRRAKSAQLSAEHVDLGGLGGQSVGRVGDQVQINPADNAAFYAWIAAVSNAGPGVVLPFTGPIVGRILTGSGKVKAT